MLINKLDSDKIMLHSTFRRVHEAFYRIHTLKGSVDTLLNEVGSEAHRWKNGFRAFHRAKVSLKDTQVNTIGCIVIPRKQIKYLKTLYLHIVACTCIFALQVGTVLIVLIRSLRPKVHVIATSYLFPVLQNCADLSIKHNIDIVSTEYARPQNSTWLEKVKRIYKIVKNKVYALFKT